MGGVAEGGVGIAEKSSPHRAAIEKVQAELRKEYDVREERKRELEFLENGGNPLDFKLGNAASVSVQSTSLTDHHPDLVTSEAKGSFALTASPHGDSVESSGRPRAPPCEPNSADNLMLFDAEHELSEGDRNSFHPSRSNIVPSEQSSPMDGSHQTRAHGDSAAFGLPRKAYKRRNRSRANRDGARSGSNDVNPARGCHGSSLPFCHGPNDVVGLASDAENLDISSNCNSKPISPIDVTPHKSVCADDQQDMELEDAKAVESTEDLIKGVSTYAASDAITSLNPLDDQFKQSSFLDDSRTHIRIDCDGPEPLHAMEKMATAAIECQTSIDVIKVENQSTSYQMNGFICKKGAGMTSDAHNSSAARGGKGLDSESCSKTNVRTDENNDTEACAKMRNVDSNGNIKNQTLEAHQSSVVEVNEFVKEEKETEVIDNSIVDEEIASASQVYKETGHSLQPEEESSQGRSALHNKLKDQFNIEGTEAGGSTGSESGRKPILPLDENFFLQSEKYCKVINKGSTDISICDLPEAGSSMKVATVSFKVQTPGGPDLKLANIDEDSILKEAEIIEAKRKRIAELSILAFPMEIRCKSHWDYVLEEMAWLANDFAQERIWKIAASAQICKRAAFTSRVRKQEKSSCVKAKNVASILATAVMEFWHSVEKTSKELKLQNKKDGAHAVQSYAARFLKYNNSNILHCQAEVPLTPDRISDSGEDMSWEENLTEENLFYAVVHGAMETYRKSIESHVARCEKIGNSVREEVETSACDAVADFESQDNLYYEDEGETSTHDISVAYANSKASRFGQKKRKHSTHAYSARLYEIGSDLLPLPMPTQYAENKIVTQQSASLAKRPGSSLNVSIPTKRVRTASRRIMSPFSAGTSGCIQVPNKADASSGDTNSFQDDQTTLRGGSFFSNYVEVESAGVFEKHLPFDSAEVSTKPKKKKKAKHPNVAFEQRWKIDSNFQNEQFQKDHLKKRPENHQLDSNGYNGLLGQPVIKKVMRQSHDGSFDNIAAIGGPVPSPVASQMSNMSNPNKFYKMIGGRDRGRKPKAHKMPAGQPGLGSPWSLFEDQALVVLVHDMGPNWELVSDAFNDILQFKCIFRKAKECKERHIILMDRTSGDGADSAEDSGSSQPYPSTLPGIPKGSARQLFQRLKEPMEEDTLKSHREKIIMIGQKLQYRKTQDPKQLQQPHSSHTIAVSQVCPNNLSGGSILSPLDLGDASLPGPDILSLGYQGPYSSGVTIPNQGSGPTMLPASGVSSALQGSSNMMHGNSFSSSPGPLSSSVRDGRYGISRSSSLSIDEQQRMQQYNQMVSGRNIQQPNMSAPGALPGIDRGVRILPGGNGIGMMCVNRSMPMARPGFQGVVSSSTVNSGSMASPGMSSVNMHSGVGSGQGNSTLRPRDAIHMMRPGLSQDSQRPMMVPDLPMQISPGNGQGVSHFGGLSSPFPNQTASSPVSSYPLQHQQSHPISPQQPQVLSPHHPHFQGPANHAPNPQQQAYAIRLAKERQLPHRFLQQQPQQQQQQQFAASNSLMSHAPPPHLPASSPMQNSLHVQSQASSPSSLSPLTSASSMNAIPQQQQKHQIPTQGVIRNAQTGGSGLTNQVSKQRQRQQQQVSQTNRQHPQLRQQSQSQQQAKVMKGIGRGNLMRHQNIPIDSSVLNGVSTNLGNQSSEKGEPITSLMETQGLQTGSSLNAVQTTRQYVSSQSSNQSLPQQKKYSSQASSSLSTHLHQMTSHSDNSNQIHVPPLAPAPGLSSVHQSVPPLAMAASNHQQVLSHQKLVTQNQSAPQRVVQPVRQFNSDQSHKAQNKGSDTDQNPTSNSTEKDAAASLPQACSNAADAVQIVSAANAHQWHASEPLLDSNVLNSATNLGSLASVPTNPSESMPQLCQGHGQRSSSASLPPIKQDVSSQWQQQPLQVQQSHSPAPFQQQQPQLLQAGNGNLYGRPSDPRLE